MKIKFNNYFDIFYNSAIDIISVSDKYREHLFPKQEEKNYSLCSTAKERKQYLATQCLNQEHIILLK